MSERHQDRGSLQTAAGNVQQFVGQTQSRAVRDSELSAARKDALRGSPKATTQDGESERRCCSGREASVPTLIVIEDDANDFLLLKRALWKAGASARVWWAQDCQEAFRVLNEVESSASSVCIVMDVRLHGSDGFELFERLRERRSSNRKKLKLVFLTGMNNEATRRRASALGADGFFVKSSDFSELVQAARALQKLASE